MNLYDFSRVVLWGVDMGKRPTIGNVAKTWIVNKARTKIGLQPQTGYVWEHWVEHQALRAWEGLLTYFMGERVQPELPADLPKKLFTTLDTALRNRGGFEDRELGTPNYWLDVRNTASGLFYWTFIVDYAPGADPGKLSSFELALEDAVTRAGYNYNIRIQKRPLRIEVDKPQPPIKTLAEVWEFIEKQPTNKRQAALGLVEEDGDTLLQYLKLAGEDFSLFITGRPGSGKTQFAMALLLSVGMMNGPQFMSMVLIDPKAIDFRPFSALPHLSMPVITEPTKAAETIQALCDEMDRRTACAARGDNSFLARTILLYIDELADLLDSLPKAQAGELVTNLRRLGQKGRALGFIVIGATQRTYDLVDDAHNKLNVRVVGKARNAQDSQAASGRAGTTTHQLPGQGSFEVYSSTLDGVRCQGLFVADSHSKTYQRELNKFFNAIKARWKGEEPGWEPGRTSEPATAKSYSPSNDWEDNLGVSFDAFYGPQAQEPEPAAPEPEPEPVKVGIDPTLWEVMEVAYAEGRLTPTAVRRLHKTHLGKSIDGKKAQTLYEAFINAKNKAKEG